MITIVPSMIGRSASMALARKQPPRRYLSMACDQTVHKLNNVLDDYLETNYSQVYPKRFKKEIVESTAARRKPAASVAVAAGALAHVTEVVSAVDINRVLQNIGAGHRMSLSEIESMLRDVTGLSASERKSCVITTDQMLDLISMVRAK